MWSFINKYLKTSNTNTKTYIGKTLEQGLYNQIEYSINENLKSINQDSNNSNSLPINQNIDQKVELKNQMLNFDIEDYLLYSQMLDFQLLRVLNNFFHLF